MNFLESTDRTIQTHTHTHTSSIHPLIYRKTKIQFHPELLIDDIDKHKQQKQRRQRKKKRIHKKCVSVCVCFFYLFQWTFLQSLIFFFRLHSIILSSSSLSFFFLQINDVYYLPVHLTHTHTEMQPGIFIYYLYVRKVSIFLSLPYLNLSFNLRAFKRIIY